MWKFCKKYKNEMLIGPFFKFLEVCFDLSVPLLMAKVIDIGIPNNDISYIFKSIILIIIMGLIGFCCTVIAQYFAAKSAVGSVASLKSALFEHIQSLSLSEVDVFSSSSLVSRLTNDTNQIQTGLNLFLRLITRSPIVIIGATFLAYLKAPRLITIFLITIIVLTTIIISITFISIPKYSKVQKQLDQVLSKVKDNLSGVRILRSFRKQQDQIDDFSRTTEGLYNNQIAVSNLSIILNPLTYAIVNIAIILIIYKGSYSIHNGTLTTGELIAVYNYMSQILVELIKLVNLIITLTKSYASYKRINEVLQTQNSLLIKNEQIIIKEAQPQIEFKNVFFMYPNSSEESLKDISFKINEGQSVGIIGATGSGKSTLVNLFSRYYEVSKGDIFYYNQNIKEYPLEQLRSLITTAFQKATLFSGTIRSNMLNAKPNATDDEIWEALKKAQIDDVTEGNLGKKVLQAGSNFSGGQKQRLTIAQALLRQSKILILDDATSALDFKTESLIKQQLSKTSSTIISISQRINNIINCDLIIVLDEGEIVGLGTHHELLKNCKVYQEIYKSQNKGDN